jgi:hypothetical protein
MAKVIRKINRRDTLKLIAIGGVSLGLLPQVTKANNVKPVQIDQPLEDSYHPTVEGYTPKSSFDRSEDVRFCIRSTVNYELRLYRLGYYSGTGATLITALRGKPENIQGDTLREPLTGLVSCDWAVSLTWKPNNAQSGFYVAQLVDSNTMTVQSHLYFVLRDDQRQAHLLVSSSDTTWQAYNCWGGSNLYEVDKSKFPDADRHTNGERTLEVSYNRPYMGTPNCFDAEWRLIFWLERNGFNVKYCAAADIDEGKVLSGKNAPRVFISSGHDEYWTQSQRSNIVQARDNGIHLAFLSGDTCFWQSRFASGSELQGIAPHGERRLLVCLKEPVNDRRGRIDILASAGWTGYWGEPDTGSGNTVETDLTGLGWKVRSTNRSKHSTVRIEVPASYTNHKLWRNTGFVGTGGYFPADTLYYEWDAPLRESDGRERLSKYKEKSIMVTKLTETLNVVSKTRYDGDPEILSDDLIRRRMGPEFFGSVTHHVLIYKNPSPKPSWVFSVGAVYWSIGLTPDKLENAEKPRVRAQQQFQINVLGIMGCKPNTIQKDLVPWVDK